jgi:hypothetical protein
MKGSLMNYCDFDFDSQIPTRRYVVVTAWSAPGINQEYLDHRIEHTLPIDEFSSEDFGDESELAISWINTWKALDH